MNVIVALAGWFWKALVFKAGVDWLSLPGNAKRERATVSAMLWVALWLGLLETLLIIALPVFPIAVPILWVVYGVSYLLIFAEYFGLGISRTFAIVGFQIGGALVWKALIPLLPI